MGNNKELVSIIVPVYKTEKYIHECVDSILNQTYNNIEVILVDDGSPDNCPIICDEYAKKDSRVRVVHKKNGGLTSSRKTGIEKFTGEYVTFVDSDDWIDKNLIKKCVDVFNKYSSDCVFYAYAKETDGKSIPVSILDKKGLLKSKDKECAYRRIFGLLDYELSHPEKLEIMTSTCMKMYKAEVIKNGAFFDTKEVGSCEDGLFNIYALKDCKSFYYIDKPLYHYRKHSGETLSTTYRPNLFKQWKRLFFEFESFIKTNKLGEEYKKALDNRIAFSMLGLGLNELDNPNKKEIKRNLKKYLGNEQISDALKHVNIKVLPLKWKVFVIACKYKFITLFVFMLKAIIYLKRKF